LAASKSDRGSDFVTVGKPLAGPLHAVTVIVSVGPGPKLYFFYLYGDLFLFRFMGLFLLLIKEFAVIDHLADRRLCIRRDLNKINSGRSCPGNCVSRVHHAQSLTV